MPDNTSNDHLPAPLGHLVIFRFAGVLLMLACALCGPQASRVDAVSHQDGGTWTVVSSPAPPTYSLQSVSATSSNDAWAVGHRGRANNGVSWGPAILRWDGQTWSELPIFELTDHFNLESVVALSPSDAWAVGGGDWWGDSFTAIFHWDGTAWNEMAGGPNYLKSITAVSPNDLWAVGVYEDWLSPINSTWGAATTHWSGTAWQGHVYMGWFALNSVAMVSATNGWAVGGGGIILHFDGSAWTRASSPTTQILRSVAMVSADNGWAVGENGTVLHWDGSTWSLASSPVTQALNSVTMSAADDGWIVGKNGTVLHLDDNTWNPVASPVTQTLKSVTMISAHEGWAVGEQGIILHYTDHPIPSINRIFLPVVIAD